MGVASQGCWCGWWRVRVKAWHTAGLSGLTRCCLEGGFQEASGAWGPWAIALPSHCCIPPTCH